MIVNLSDINKTSELTHCLPPAILRLYKNCDTRATMFMVYHAQSITQCNNDILGVYPNPKTRKRRKS